MYLFLRAEQRVKTRRRTFACSSTRTIPISERSWTDIEPENYSSIAYPVSKQLSTLLRHGDLLREEDGAIEFWRLKDYLRNDFCAFSTSVCWHVEEYNGKRRRKQENISILSWSVRTRNSLPPSSPMSFRTQSHWSFTTGQCVHSGRFLRVHLSHWMCNQVTFHHKFRIWYLEDKILAGTDRRYSSQLWIPCIRITKIQKSLIWPNHVFASYQSGKCTKMRCIGSIFSLLNEKDWSSIKQDRTQSSSTIHSQLIVSRMQLWWNLKKSYIRKVYVSPRPPTISYKDKLDV